MEPSLILFLQLSFAQFLKQNVERNFDYPGFYQIDVGHLEGIEDLRRYIFPIGFSDVVQNFHAFIDFSFAHQPAARFVEVTVILDLDQ